MLIPFLYPPSSHVQTQHTHPEPVLGASDAEAKDKATAAEKAKKHEKSNPAACETPAVPPKSFTEDMTFLDDKEQALSCVYYEQAVAVAQFTGNAQDRTHVVCARAGKAAARAEPGSAVLDLAELSNPYRADKTERVRRFIGSGVELCVRQRSLYVTRHSRNGVFVKAWDQPARFCLQEYSEDAVRRGSVAGLVGPGGELPLHQEVCLFDFQVRREGWEEERVGGGEKGAGLGEGEIEGKKGTE